MASYCTACEELRADNPNFVLNGITDKECGSLQEDTGLNPDLQVPHNNCEDLNTINDCLVGNLGEMLETYDICELDQYIRKLMKNLYNLNKALICSDCGEWKNIHSLWSATEDIKKEIADIWDMLDALANQNYTFLTPGSDYDISFFNNYYNTANTVGVSVLETPSSYLVRVTHLDSTAAGAYNIRNDNLKSVKMRHGTAPSEMPDSWILSLAFKGKYSNLNQIPIVNAVATGKNVWTVIPTEARASWDATTSISHNVSGNPFLMSLVSYSDGYNTQFDVYQESLSLLVGTFSIDFTLLKP